MAVKLEIIRELVSTKPQIEPSDEYQGQISTPEDLSMDWRIEYEERAAILEYDGGLSRDASEIQALAEITKRMRRLNEKY